jgi:hypothetical protein
MPQPAAEIATTDEELQYRAFAEAFRGTAFGAHAQARAAALRRAARDSTKKKQLQ